jgi:copper oxidase (laccase) domain-containing protein
MSTRADGDFHIEQSHDTLERTRRRFVDLPWSMPDEVHGTTVLEVTAPGEHDGAVADALVTDLAGVVLGAWVGDCAPVAMWSSHGRIGVAHAGWKGLEAGVLQATATAMRAGDPAARVTAVLGACIHPCCYEFGDADLGRLRLRFGNAVVGRTRAGAPALDVPAAVRIALAEVGVDLDDRSACTGCDADRWYSHRVRAERGRQVLAVWKEDVR